MTRTLRLTPDTIHRMTLTTEPWLSCDDCFDHLDAVVERVLMQAGAMERGVPGAPDGLLGVP